MLVQFFIFVTPVVVPIEYSYRLMSFDVDPVNEISGELVSELCRDEAIKLDGGSGITVSTVQLETAIAEEFSFSSRALMLRK